MKKTGLDAYTSDELLQELHRRETKRERDKPIKRWCEDCKHFRYWKARSEPPDDHNCCQKKHEMSFRMPRHEDGPHPPHDTFGFYRRNCWDFTPRPQEPSPPPPPPPDPQTLLEERTDAARKERMRRERGE